MYITDFIELRITNHKNELDFWLKRMNLVGRVLVQLKGGLYELYLM